MLQQVERHAFDAWGRRLAAIRTFVAGATLIHERRLITQSFSKWTDGCLRHGEQLSLMQSFRDVKAEGRVVISIDVTLSTPC